jgi:hypothetical protein
LVVKEIEIEEARRAKLGATPVRPAEAQKTARALSILTQTYQVIERLRHGREIPPSPEDNETSDDLPSDIDEFRRELARRIDTFVASRTDARNAGAGGTPPLVDETR